MHRIADAYVELQFAMLREAKADQTGHAEETYQLARMPARKAINFYRELADDYQSYARSDEVLYYLGLHHDRMGEVSEARKAYYALIERMPKSKLVPLCYLAFAELFSAEADADAKKLDLAVQAYTEVVKFPAPENHAYLYALFRLGETKQMRGDKAGAISAYELLASHAKRFPTLPGAKALSERGERRLRALRG
jgi:tetratricopeptide (TPR) repeat protein